MDEETKNAYLVLLTRDHFKLPESYPLVVSKIIRQYLFELMGEKMSITNVVEEKPHMTEVLKDVCALLACNVIEMRHAKELLYEAWENYWNVGDYLVWSGLLEEAGTNELMDVVNQLIKDSPKVVEAYKKGKKQAIGALIGQAMKKFDGKADPKELRSLFKEQIEEIS